MTEADRDYSEDFREIRGGTDSSDIKPDSIMNLSEILCAESENGAHVFEHMDDYDWPLCIYCEKSADAEYIRLLENIARLVE